MIHKFHREHALRTNHTDTFLFAIICNICSCRLLLLWLQCWLWDRQPRAGGTIQPPAVDGFFQPFDSKLNSAPRHDQLLLLQDAVHVQS